MFLSDEVKSFERIKRLLFLDKSHIPYRDFNGKTYLDIDEETFKNDFYIYANTENRIFGLSQKDTANVLNVIKTAQKNNDTTFPDYFTNNGIIEHFCVTASKESSKGSKEIIEHKKFEKSIDKEKQEFIQYCNENEELGIYNSKVWKRKCSGYSYENLVNSFKKNFENHINSLEKYNQNKEVKIFLIDNCEFALEMYEDIYCDVKENIRIDYKKKPEHFINFRLSRDKNLLKYLYEFKDKIDYVIFYFDEDFEIIKLENIPSLLTQLPYNYLIVGRNIELNERIVNVKTRINL